MVDNRDELAQLRRAAFGPGATAEERAAAEKALRRLNDRAREGEPRATNVPVADALQPAVSEEPHDRTDQFERVVAVEDVEPSLWKHSIRVAWVVPIVLGSIALGYAASFVPLNAERNSQNSVVGASPTPSSAAQRAAPEDNAQSGDLEAADSWFDRAYRDSDTFPQADALEYYGVKPEDMRIAVNGGDKGSVWVARADGKLCLILADPIEGSSASSCVERDRFVWRGIALNSNNLGASWFGREVMTSPTIVPVATGSLPEMSGPGNLVAAVSWFYAPALPPEDLPSADLLAAAQVNPGDVRRVIPESTPWVKLWVATHSTGGYCMLSVDDAASASAWACATIDEFLERGLALPAEGYMFFWDGTGVSVSVSGQR